MARPMQWTNRGHARHAVALACALAAIVTASPGRAQPPPAPGPQAAADPRIEEAREAFRIGSALAKQAQWVDALAAFGRSARLRPHAVTTFNIAFCERALGRYARARKSFALALAAPEGALPENLAAESRGYLADIEQRLVRAAITMIRPGAALAVDGRPLEITSGGSPSHPTLVAGSREPGPGEPAPAASFDLLLDPGTHVIIVSMNGAPDAVVIRDFTPGAVPSLTLGPGAAPAKALVDVAPRAGLSPGRRAAAAMSFGLAGAGLLAGAVMGGLALHDRQSLDRQCKTKSHCPGSAQGTIDAMNDFATGSTIGFALLLAGAGVGGVVLLTADGAKPPAPRGPTASPWLGPGYAGIRGAF